jgi:hypothetical protein
MPEDSDDHAAAMQQHSSDFLDFTGTDRDRPLHPARCRIIRTARDKHGYHLAKQGGSDSRAA